MPLYPDLNNVCTIKSGGKGKTEQNPSNPPQLKPNNQHIKKTNYYTGFDFIYNYNRSNAAPAFLPLTHTFSIYVGLALLLPRQTIMPYPHSVSVCFIQKSGTALKH